MVNEDFGLPSPRTQEPSNDGTEILPSPLNESTLAQHQPPDAFPVFKNGDVIITTDLGPFPRTFQLHSSVLCRHSPFNGMETYPGESWYHFTIEEIKGKVSLIRKSADGERPLVSRDSPQIIDGTHIKVEDPSDTGTSPVPTPSSPALVAATKPPRHSTTIACYTQIFASFYNIPPKVSTTDISTAVAQSEALTKLATSLGSVQPLQAHLASLFSSYRQTLYLAIAHNPPRWLHLSLALQNRAIYTECLIHLVGAHPKMPWPKHPTPIPDPIHHLIQQKALDLANLRGASDRALLLLTLHIADPLTQKNRACDPRNKAEIESWLAVQVFRDEMAQHISAVGNHPSSSLHLGRLYRGIARGDWKWMSTEYVRAMLEPTMKLGWKELGEDLRSLRAQAKGVVGRLARNGLMVEPDGHGVGYLTCVEVGEGDVPWLSGGM
ncbi:hypothetical protein P171DRAFT_483488 [Karstenula rhodostoma CBS 690.94]|uniref:BTB domain-containing protein n=1 Tax=Karstenula rhodostoma CBS 690.94 TaxID=1392251 RepID=A0A9P4PMZ8_9PLEO|nr:hypothetical protein P171DRAFT_483488 [Karstenula rhodostoma CBS 690.94]